MLYHVLHTCGHTSEQGTPDAEETEIVTDPKTGHQHRYITAGAGETVHRRVSKHPCWPCRRGQFNEENEEAAAHADEQGWPDLDGSPKQIAWGQSLRRTAIEQATQEVRSLYSGNPGLLAMSVQILLEETDARWWINQRFDIRKWPRYSWLGFFNRAHVYPDWVKAAAPKGQPSLYEDLRLELDNTETHDELRMVLFRAQCALHVGRLSAPLLQSLTEDGVLVRLRLDAEWGN